MAGQQGLSVPSTRLMTDRLCVKNNGWQTSHLFQTSHAMEKMINLPAIVFTQSLSVISRGLGVSNTVAAILCALAMCVLSLS